MRRSRPRQTVNDGVGEDADAGAYGCDGGCGRGGSSGVESRGRGGCCGPERVKARWNRFGWSWCLRCVAVRERMWARTAPQEKETNVLGGG